MAAAGSNALVAALYFASTKPFFVFSESIGQPLPVYPAAGVAAAAVFLCGLGALPGVIAGWVALAWPGPLEHSLTRNVQEAFAIAIEAALAGWTVRRVLGTGSALDTPRDVALFLLLCGPVASLAGTALSMLALAHDQVRFTGSAGVSFFTWWAGDTLGAILVAPMLVALLGKPRGHWRFRVVHVVLPGLAALLLVATSMTILSLWERRRLDQQFAKSSSLAKDEVQAALATVLAGVDLVRASVESSGSEPTRDGFVHEVEPLMRRVRGVGAAGWAPFVARAQWADFEAHQRSQGAASYAVHAWATHADVQRLQGDTIAPVTILEPPGGTAPASGLDLLSGPASRDAIEQAKAGHRVVLSPPMRFDAALDGPRTVLAYAVAARGTHQGIVFVALRLPDLLASAARVAPQLELCLSDATSPQPVDMIGHGCAAPDYERSRRLLLEAGSRRWQLDIFGMPGPAMSIQQPALATVEALALLGSSAFMGFILIWSGRTRAVTELAQQRAASLLVENQERRLAESAMRDSEARFRRVFESAGVGIALLDPQGKIDTANPALLAMALGEGAHVPHALQGTALDEILSPEARARWHATQSSLLDATARSGRFDAELLRAGGGTTPVAMNVSLLQRGADVSDRFLVVIEDLSERMQRERAEKTREAATLASQAKTEFLSHMSHELKTPLNAILGFAQLLQARPEAIDAAAKAHLALIEKAGWHLLDLINDVFELARIEAGELRVTNEAIALDAVMTESVSLMSNLAAGAQVKIETPSAWPPAMLWADPLRLRQILLNLLSNAIKYNRPGGRIVIGAAVRPQDARMLISIADTGIGMSEQQLARLFQPFERLGMEQSRVEGSGLGLVICRQLARAMGGDLVASSRSGVGSTFELSIPLAREVNASSVPPAP